MNAVFAGILREHQLIAEPLPVSLDCLPDVILIVEVFIVIQHHMLCSSGFRQTISRQTLLIAVSSRNLGY
jgi:hypothetical protein